ncbi:hypothetical protein J0895_07080 [Phormidium pseudopriestleyi FRX01]|uniref:Uncharacterized protein n=1 Tax=Phormidium pseudopriestleyi FRX01 TaxID=1759528 RepID=A0ABS3FP27_9CYAN|nr:hypothetical protein [Phormidium pseudopriestleyi]MBO0348865.1 hypothetical protein [Phormidium pseudopriestleyi FRX01]
MEVYVQSGGVSKEYSWVNEQNQPILLPDDDLKPMLNMVDSDYFSVVIYRPKEDRLLLLVTALPSKSRMDNRTRKIYNSVLWVGDTSDEATLRAIAIKALNVKLEEKVHEAVESENNDQGFKVDFDKLKSKNLELDLNAVKDDKPADSPKVGNLSACNKELIEDLEKYALPKNKGMLVVVCSTVSDDILKQAKVWRGLSDEISDDDLSPFEVAKDDNFRSGSTTGNSTSKNVGKSASDSQQSSSRSQITPNSTIGFPHPNRTSQNSGQTKKWLNLIAAFILGLVIGIIANQLWYHFTENQLQQKIQSLKGDITELEQDKDSLGKAIKIKQQEIKAYEKFESDSETRYSHFRDEVEKSYESFIRDSEKSKQALQSEINALQNKANELNAKSS